MTPENNNRLQEIHSSKTNKLDEYLSSELKLQESIDTKLTDPNIKELAKKEITDIKTRFESSLSKTMEVNNSLNSSIILESQNARQQLLGEMNSSYVIKDLIDDFNSDLESLSNIEKNYKNYDGYDEFVDLLKNSFQETREKVYTIFGDNNNINSLKVFLDENEGLPISNQEITTFLKKFENSINVDNLKEISEILDDTRDLNTYSIKELLYKKDKLLSLKDNIGAGTEIENKYKQKLSDLDIIIDLSLNNFIEQDKSQQEQDKSQQEQDKSQQDLLENEKNKNIISGIKNDIPGIKNFPYEELKDGEILKSLISQLENSETDEDFKEISTQIAEFALKGDNLKNIFELASKNKETYEKMHSFFTGVATISKNENFIQALSIYPTTYERVNSMSPLSSKNAILSSYFGDTGSVLKDGEKYYKGDTRIDLGTKPPKIETFNQNTGYSLELENNISNEIERNALEKTKIYNEMLDLKKEEISLNNKIETLQNLLLDENKLLVYSRQQNKSVEEIKNQINLVIINLNNKLESITKQYNQKREKYISLQNTDFLKDLEEQKETQREVLKFLSSIGFDLIPQSITDSVINQLNLNTALRSKLGFTMEIDIKNGLLGTDSDANISNITSKEKADFARAFNIMISGEETSPINLDSVLNERGAPISDMARFSAEIDRAGLKDPGKANLLIMNNIRNFGKEEGKTQ